MPNGKLAELARRFANLVRQVGEAGGRRQVQLGITNAFREAGMTTRLERSWGTLESLFGIQMRLEPRVNAETYVLLNAIRDLEFKISPDVSGVLRDNVTRSLRRNSGRIATSLEEANSIIGQSRARALASRMVTPEGDAELIGQTIRFADRADSNEVMQWISNIDASFGVPMNMRDPDHLRVLPGMVDTFTDEFVKSLVPVRNEANVFAVDVPGQVTKKAIGDALGFTPSQSALISHAEVARQGRALSTPAGRESLLKQISTVPVPPEFVPLAFGAVGVGTAVGIASLQEILIRQAEESRKQQSKIEEQRPTIGESTQKGGE